MSEGTVFSAQVFAAFAEYLRANGQRKAAEQFVAQYQQYIAQALADQVRMEEVLKQQKAAGNLPTEATASQTEIAEPTGELPVTGMRITKRIYDNEPGVLERVLVMLYDQSLVRERQIKQADNGK